MSLNKALPANKGSMHIILSKDPREVPKVIIEGDWNIREVHSLDMFIKKAFRSYTADLRRKQDALKEKENERSE